MDDLRETAKSVVDRIIDMSTQEADLFLRRRMANKTLSPLMRELNAEVLSGDKARRETAEAALSRLGFV